MTDGNHSEATGADGDPNATGDIVPAPASDALAFESQSFQCVPDKLCCFDPYTGSVIQHPGHGSS